MGPAYKALITCTPGLESFVQSELRTLRVMRSSRVAPGAVAAQLTVRQLCEPA
jgi:23S rRNA G2445 N2-methylase RlmL